MFCKFMGKGTPKMPKETTYYLADSNFTQHANGALRVVIPGLYNMFFSSFEEFLTDWEIV